MSAARSSWRWRAAAALCLFSIVSYWNAYVCDDAFIMVRTVDNFVRGEGLRWNVEERVQTFTSPLHTLLVSIPYWVAHDRGPQPNPDRAYWVLIAFSFALSCLMIAWLARELEGLRFWFVFAVLMSSQAFVAFTSSGLETAQVYLLTAVFYTRFLGGRSARTPKHVAATFALAAAAVLTRLDLALVFLLPCVHALGTSMRRSGLRATLVSVLPGTLLLLAWFGFALVYFGFLLPNTYYAKLGLDVDASIKRSMGWHYLGICWRFDRVTLAATGAAIALCWSSSRTLCAGLSGLLYIAYFVSIGGDFLGWRLLAPPFLISILVLQDVVAARCAGWSRVVFVSGIVCAALYASFTPGSPIRSWRELTRQPDVRYYMKSASVALWRPGMTFPFGRHLSVNDQCACIERRPSTFTVAVSANGLNGFCRGPLVHMLDPNAITDPLIARISIPLEGVFRPGHLRKPLPAGYFESVLTNENRFVDPELARFYDELRAVVAGPLFSRERWRCIWRLGFTERSRFRGDFARIEHPLPREWKLPGVERE